MTRASSVPANLQAALSYLRAGLGVLPILADGSKAPALPAGHRYLYERPTEAVAERWFRDGRTRSHLLSRIMQGFRAF